MYVFIKCIIFGLFLIKYINFRLIMPKNIYLNDSEKDQIIKLSSEGRNAYQIGKIINRHHQTIKKYLDNPSLYGKGILRSGRKSIISERDKRVIANRIRNKKSSTRNASRDFCAEISHQTVWRIARKSKLEYITFLKSPVLTKKHKCARFEFAKSVILKNDDFRNSIIFSDEKRFCLDGPDGYKYYWHDLRKEKSICSQNAYSAGVMVWGAISVTGKRVISFVEGNINSKKYIEVLENNLLPTWSSTDFVFQQDNASAHKAKQTISWCENQNFKLLDWPAKSPDLNIIENIWGILANNIYREKINYNNLNELKESILREWDKIPSDIIFSLYKSFPNRLIDVISRKGGFLVK